MNTITETITEKLQNIINDYCDSANKYGSAKLSTCNYSGWDRDIWNHHSAIITAIQKRGYRVTVSVNWGVTDILIVKNISLT